MNRKTEEMSCNANYSPTFKGILAITTILLFLQLQANAQYVYTVAGGGRSNEEIAPLSLSVTPGSVTSNPANGKIYFTDLKMHAVRVFDPQTNQVITIAGGNGAGFSGDNGPGIAAKFDDPRGLCLDPTGAYLYVADRNNRRIRRIDLSNGAVTTIGGNGQTGYSNVPVDATTAAISVRGITTDADGNIFFADPENHVVRRIAVATNLITTVAGNGQTGNDGDNGQATAAKMSSPADVQVDADGNLFIIDQFNHNLRKVDAEGKISTIAGTGTLGFSGDGDSAVHAQLRTPEAILLGDQGSLFIADRGNGRVRRIGSDAIISTLAGNGVSNYQGDGDVATSTSSLPIDLAWGSTGLIVAEGYNRIRIIDASDQKVTTFIGNGSPSYEGDGDPSPTALLYNPTAVFKDHNGDVYVVDQLNHSIRKIDSLTSVITTIAGTGLLGFSADGTLATSARLQSPADVTVANDGTVFFVERSSNRIRKIDPVNGKLVTVAGTGTSDFAGDGGLATAAKLSSPSGICIDKDGNIYISDNNRIRKIDAVSKKINTIAGTGLYGYTGDGASALNAKLNNPRRIVVDADGNLFFTDEANHAVRKIDKASGNISTVAGTGVAGFHGDGAAATSAKLNYPVGLSIDQDNNLFIADRDNSRIRKVDAATGAISTVVGNGTAGRSADGLTATETALNKPEGVFADRVGRIYLADTKNDRVVVSKAQQAVITFSNTVQTYTGNGLSVTATTNPANVSLRITYNGNTDLPVNAGTYEVHAVTDNSFYDGEAWTTLTIIKAVQTITFDSITAKSMTDGSFVLSATASSGLPVTYSIPGTDVASIDSATVTFNALGTVAITASQAGNENYFAAENVVRYLVVVEESRVITIAGDLEFGSVGVGESAQKTITVSNSGNAPLAITAITVPDGFTASPNTGTILPNDELDITVTFMPTAAIVYEGSLSVSSNATSGENELDISGAGLTVTSGEQEEATQITAFPNPGNGTIYVRVARPINDRVRVLDNSGRTVKSGLAKDLGDNTYLLDISELKAGVYVLWLSGDVKPVRYIKEQ